MLLYQLDSVKCCKLSLPSSCLTKWICENLDFNVTGTSVDFYIKLSGCQFLYQHKALANLDEGQSYDSINNINKLCPI